MTTITDEQLGRVSRATTVWVAIGAVGAVAASLVWEFVARGAPAAHAVVQLAASAAIALFGTFALVELWWLVGALLLLRRVRAMSSKDSVVLLGARMYDVNAAIDKAPTVKSRDRVGAFFVIVADQHGLAVWTGALRPRVAVSIPWSAVKGVGTADRVGFFRRAIGVAFQLDSADSSLLLPLVPIRALGSFVDVSGPDVESARSEIESVRVRE